MSKSSHLPGLKGTLPVASEDQYIEGTKNAAIGAFLTRHGKPYDAADDDYDKAPFSSKVSAKKNTAIYNMHTYWSKKPHDAIEQYVRHYTSAGDVILDPMCGSGGTAVAAIISGRHAVAIDLSPAAAFVTANYTQPLEPREFERAAQTLFSLFNKSGTSALFRTKCHLTDKEATVLRTVYSSRYICNRCVEKVALYDCPTHDVIGKGGKPKSTTVCPHCLRSGHLEELSAHNRWIDKIPVATEYRVGARGTVFRSYNDQDSKARQYFETYDLPLIEQADKTPINDWFPDRYMLDVESDDETSWGLLWRPYHRGIRKVEDWFTKRNLNVLATLFALINAHFTGHTQRALKFAVTGILPGLSWLNRYRPDVSFPLNYSANTLYVPPVGTEENPIPHLVNKVKRISKGFEEMESVERWGSCVVSTQDACDLGNIPSNSIDYIFTDPPYGYRIQYGELNFLWESWLNFNGDWRSHEIIINESETRERSFQDWVNGLRRAMEECYRVLKPGRWLSLCFHDSSTEVWQAVQDVMAETGFLSDRQSDVVAIETDYQTHKQSVAKQIAKRDLVLSFRKPRPDDWNEAASFIPADVDSKTFRELGKQVCSDFLIQHPGTTKDRVYDYLVSRMVSRGQLQAHDFDALLQSVAEQVDERWYLTEESDELNVAEKDKEDASAAMLEGAIAKYLESHPELEGTHYSEVFEMYLVLPDKPRRLLRDWLPEYFYMTPDGTWRPPSDEAERQQKAAVREAGTLRRMKRFANALLEGVPVRDQDRPDSARTLAEWIRQCRRAGLYEQGRVMYEKGGLDLDRLNEDEQIEVEDDYRICVKRGSEEETSKKPKGRKKTS